MKKRAKQTKRHGGRVVLSLDVEPSAREALREKAARAGVSMAEYFANAIAEPEKCTYRTATAETAWPLIRVSDLNRQAMQALKGGDIEAALTALGKASTFIHDALRPLARRHQEEVRANERALGVTFDYRAHDRASRPPHEER